MKDRHKIEERSSCQRGPDPRSGFSWIRIRSRNNMDPDPKPCMIMILFIMIMIMNASDGEFYYNSSCNY